MVDLAGVYVELSLVAEWQLAENRFPKFLARGWDIEFASLKVAYSHTRSVGIDEVSDLAAAIGQDGRFIFAIEQLAVANKESCSDSVAERLGLKIQ